MLPGHVHEVRRLRGLYAVTPDLADTAVLVAKVEAEFAVRRNETNVARISKPLSEYLAALGVVSQKAVMLDSAVAGTGGVNVDVLFPPGDSRDTLADFMERQEMLRMWASLVSMGQPRAGWEGPMATPYLFRKLA